MQTGSVTTPFGRRRMTLALVRQQQALAEIRPGKAADKWKVFRSVAEAKDILSLQSNSVAVLNALLSFLPGNELRQDGQLIVFPSNIQLSLRSHGMADATLRRHIAILVQSGLIVRKDSANGKRYARKDGAGEIDTAFGFDLSPLLARSEELAVMAQQVVAERAVYRKAKENLTICRRDVRKLITAAVVEGAEGDWNAIEAIYVALVTQVPRTPSLTALVDFLSKMEILRAEVLNRLEGQEELQNKSGNDDQGERHIQSSDPESRIELEPRYEKERRMKASPGNQQKKRPSMVFPLGLVLKACPAVVDYAPRGSIQNWRDLMSAAVVVGSTLGVSPSAYQEACETMGPENAAVAMACILERAGFISSAGGYLRDLSRRAEREEFSLGPMLMALLKANSQVRLRAA